MEMEIFGQFSGYIDDTAYSDSRYKQEDHREKQKQGDQFDQFSASCRKADTENLSSCRIEVFTFVYFSFAFPSQACRYGLMVITGQQAFFTTLSATLPNIIRSSPL